MSHRLSKTARGMLWRALRMGAQGFYTALPREQRVCERARQHRLLAFKGGRRSRGYFQFYVLTAAGCRAYGGGVIHV